MERASLVIVNWNAGAALHACLAAVFSSDGIDRDQVILVDNASTDGSQFGLTTTYPALEVIQNSRNIGFARAVNQGLVASRGEFAVLLNPDVILEPSALSRLTEFMIGHPCRLSPISSSIARDAASGSVTQSGLRRYQAGSSGSM